MNRPEYQEWKRITKREALEQTLKVWEFFSKNPHLGPDDKERVVEDLLGYAPMIHCPACEYAGPDPDDSDNPDCDNCPMDEWDSEQPCFEAPEGEYLYWLLAITAKDRQPWAEAIAQRAKNSLENLGDEE